MAGLKSRNRKNGSAGMILLIICAIGLGLGLSFRPWQGFFEQRRQAQELKTELNIVEHNRANLLRKEAKSGSGIAQEEALRKKGYALPDEKPLN